MSRPRRIDARGEGFGVIAEAPRKDSNYTSEELDQLFNFMMVSGPTEANLHEWAKFFGRSVKGTQRQWELALYSKEKGTHVGKYKPGTMRQRRHRQPFSLTERILVTKHLKDSVPPAHTADILHRSVREIIDFQDTLCTAPHK